MERNVNVVEDWGGHKIVVIHDVIFQGKRSVKWVDVEQIYLYDIIKIKKETSNLFQSEDLTQ